MRRMKDETKKGREGKTRGEALPRSAVKIYHPWRHRIQSNGSDEREKSKKQRCPRGHVVEVQ